MNLYHISEKNLNNEILYPRIPSNYMAKNGYEDNKIPRISFSKSIDGCLMALSANIKGKEFYIHMPIDDNIKIKNITKNEVPDANLTDEVWVLGPVKIKVIGKLKVINVINKPLTYEYGNNKAKLYKWKWEMIPLTESVEGVIGMNTEKVEYSSIIETYINTEIELNNIFNMEYIMEAENASVNKDSDETKGDASNTILTRISALIEKIIEVINNLVISLKNKFQQLMITDKGFEKELARVQRDRKPLNAIKVISYKYLPEFLNSQYSKLKTTSNNLISKVSSADAMDPNSPLLLDNTEFERMFLKNLGYTEGSSFKEYLSFVKKTFRGEKKEITILKAQIPVYKKNVDSYKGLYTTLNTDLIALKDDISKLKNRTKLTVKNPNSADIDKKKITVQIRNLMNLYNFYLGYTNLYHELTVELMLSSRIILRKMYQIQR